jgi:hypothetical protein
VLKPLQIREYHDSDSFRARSSQGSLLHIEFDGADFPYEMARLIIGALVRCALGKLSA